MIPSYTSEKTQRQIESWAKRFKDPSHYRRVNKVMDDELIWYRGEIERRFKKSVITSWPMPRLAEDKIIEAPLGDSVRLKHASDRILKKRGNESPTKKRRAVALESMNDDVEPDKPSQYLIKDEEKKLINEYFDGVV